MRGLLIKAYHIFKSVNRQKNWPHKDIQAEVMQWSLEASGKVCSCWPERKFTWMNKPKQPVCGQRFHPWPSLVEPLLSSTNSSTTTPPFTLEEFNKGQVQREAYASAAMTKACAEASPVKLESYNKAALVQAETFLRLLLTKSRPSSWT